MRPIRGESYVSGSFEGTATFGQGQPNETKLIARGQRPDFFIAKFADLDRQRSKRE